MADNLLNHPFARTYWMHTHQTNFLLVDDDPIATAATEGALKFAPPGTKLNAVADGIQAYRYMNGTGLYNERSIYPLPDVILLDIHMPRLNGLEFLRWLREQGPVGHRSTSVVMISSSAFTEHIEYARALGVQLFLHKPIRWSKFWDEVAASCLLAK